MREANIDAAYPYFIGDICTILATGREATVVDVYSRYVVLKCGNGEVTSHGDPKTNTEITRSRWDNSTPRMFVRTAEKVFPYEDDYPCLSIRAFDLAKDETLVPETVDVIIQYPDYTIREIVSATSVLRAMISAHKKIRPCLSPPHTNVRLAAEVGSLWGECWGERGIDENISIVAVTDRQYRVFRDEHDMLLCLLGGPNRTSVYRRGN